MGKVVVKNVVLKNHKDEILAEAGMLSTEQIRQLTLDMVVDTGATNVSLPQTIVEQLGLTFLREDEVTLADHSKRRVRLYRDLVVYIDDRQAIVQCIAKPSSPNLLGVIVLEVINYVVDPNGGRIFPNPNATPGMIGYEEFGVC